MKGKIITLTFILLPLLSFATPQSRDIIHWNGKKYYSYPSIMQDRADFINLTKYINERYDVEFTKTSNYNGYICEFKIENDTLFLYSILDSHDVNYMEYVFGSSIQKPITDYTGVIYLGYGKVIEFYEMATLIYESEITVNFENGIVKSFKDNKNKSKSSYYDSFNLTKYIHENLNLDECNVGDLNENSKVYVEFTTDTLGKVIMAKVAKSSGNEDFDREATKAVLSIPNYQVIFVKGEYYQNTWLQLVSYKIWKKYRNE